MRLWVCAFIVGVVLRQAVSQPSLLICAGLICGVISLLCLLLCIKKYCNLIRLTSLLLAMSIGFLWLSLFWYRQQNNGLPTRLENKKIVVQGIIDSIPESKDSAARFLFKIESWQEQGKKRQQPLRAKLNWYQNNQFKPSNLPRAGEHWQLVVKLKKPHGFHNPGSFDYEKSLIAHHINATGYVINHADNTLLHAAHYHHLIDQVRQHLDDRLNKALTNYPLAGQIKALTIGMSDAISQAQWQVFKATGTVHLMIIAGLHIGLVSGFIFFLVQWGWRRSLYLCLCIPANQAAALASLIMAWIYSALAGFSIPTQRAMIMISIFMGMQLLRRNLSSWNAYCLTLLLIIVWDPLATLEAGFWLSFVAVALIIYGVSGRLNLGNHWQKLGHIQVILGIGLIPLTLLWFQQASVSGMIANAIAIPWVGFVVAPLSLMGILFTLLPCDIARFILIAAERAMELFWPVLQWLAEIKWLNWQQAIPNIWVLSASLWGVVLLLAPKGWPGKWVGSIFLLPLFFYKPAVPRLGEVWLTLLDVGQGLAAVIQTQHHVLVYDTGPKLSAEFDTGSAVVVPFLRILGTQHLDALVISHEDNDHSGGATALLKAFPAEKIFSSVPEKLQPSPAQLCLQGEEWQWDGVKFKFLYPTISQLHLDNNSSCVLRITVGQQHVLLTGDIEKEAEYYLLQHHLSELAATVLIAPHHGSGTSSSVEFVQGVRPHWVLFPVGYLNKYHLPKAAIIDRYQQVGSIIYDTAQYGAIAVKLM